MLIKGKYLYFSLNIGFNNCKFMLHAVENLKCMYLCIKKHGIKSFFLHLKYKIFCLHVLTAHFSL